MESSYLRPALPKSLYNRIEEDVVKLHINLKLGLPVNPHIVAERLGLIIHRFSEITDPDALYILKTSSEESHDGLSYRDPNLGTYVIWVNDLATTYEPRLNFTIMHEIGHIRMGHRGDSPLAEMIANYYAAYALVPSPLPSMLNCNSYLDIIDEFNVSSDCAFNCARRCMNWARYGGSYKPYEEKLRSYYKALLNKDGR